MRSLCSSTPFHETEARLISALPEQTPHSREESGGADDADERCNAEHTRGTSVVRGDATTILTQGGGGVAESEFGSLCLGTRNLRRPRPAWRSRAQS